MLSNNMIASPNIGQFHQISEGHLITPIGGVPTGALSAQRGNIQTVVAFERRLPSPLVAVLVSAFFWRGFRAGLLASWLEAAIGIGIAGSDLVDLFVRFAGVLAFTSGCSPVAEVGCGTASEGIVAVAADCLAVAALRPRVAGFVLTVVALAGAFALEEAAFLAGLACSVASDVKELAIAGAWLLSVVCRP